ncbi:MAG: hypothetical protein RL223_470 [Pseudomonadota bacterium]
MSPSMRPGQADAVPGTVTRRPPTPWPEPPGPGELRWHDEVEWLGLRVRAWFFDPRRLPAQLAWAQAQRERTGQPLAPAQLERLVQLLPCLADWPVQPLGLPGERSVCHAGALQARPELLLRIGDGRRSGLLCLGNRGPEATRPVPTDSWFRELDLQAMLQAVAVAMAASGEYQLPAVALWRGPNVVYQVDPGSVVLAQLAAQIGPACHYWGELRSLSPAQLASFCEPRLRSLPALKYAAPLGTP